MPQTREGPYFHLVEVNIVQNRRVEERGSWVVKKTKKVRGGRGKGKIPTIKQKSCGCVRCDSMDNVSSFKQEGHDEP